ncbi:MAG: hypothetical protein H7Y03_06135 [Chitinophagaceae bacterium]|nr:hypothetical protein [Chitinophagaceae bacterium]
MKKNPLLLLLLCTHFFVSAQFKTMAEGEVFREPESGFAKIVQLKNGYTIFCHVENKDGIDLKIYDKNHRLKAVKHLEPNYGKLKGGSIEGIFEIKGDLVLLISEIDSKSPTLYRLIIDANNGNLKKEETIAELIKVTYLKKYALAFGVSNPEFYVRKDPDSENYAVALFNSLESDRNKRIEVIFYGSDHKEISRAFYTSPEERYKYMRYIDMTVIGDQKVSILAYAYNTRSSGGKESELVIANLEAGAKSVKITELDFTKDRVITKGITRYNPVTKKVVMLAYTQENARKGEFSLFLSYIDPFSSTIENAVSPFPEKAYRKSLEVFDTKKGFRGGPQNLFINSDGSFTIVYESLTLEMHTSGSNNYTSTNTRLGSIAVSKYDLKGEEVSTYFIPKEHLILGTSLPSFYLSQREGTAQVLAGGNQFKSFAYLNGKDKSYVLFNDIERNVETLEKKNKLTCITGVGECDGFYYTLDSKSIIPSRDFVFGKPDEKREHNLAIFSISDYDRDNNIYATLKLEKEGRQKGVKVVWMQPQ